MTVKAGVKTPKNEKPLSDLTSENGLSYINKIDYSTPLEKSKLTCG
jgi:hypothetical protein